MHKIITNIILKIDKKRREDIFGKITPYLNKTDKILDLGCGNCALSKDLLDRGYTVTPVDVKNISLFKSIKPIVYDGKRLPFKDNLFDTALLITVLHHTPNPPQVLKEAARVCKKLVVMEDVYENSFQKYATFIMDSVGNLEIFGHPHSNKSQKEWQKVFKDLNLKIIEIKIHNFWKIFTSATFFLKK